jgi:glycosyltransferase involved in cell wall biosynthesis
MDVSIVLPTKNEEKAIGFVLKKCREALEKSNLRYEIVVVDCSSDKTPEIAESFGVKVIKGVEGYGSACIEGFRNSSGKILIFMDADGSYDPKHIPELIEPIAKGEADLVLGSRFKGKMMPGSMPGLHRIGNFVLTYLLNRFFDLNLSDAHTGMRAIKREGFEKLQLKCRGMEFATEMIVKAKKSGLRISEIPVTYSKRIGKSKLRTFRDGWRHLRFMLLLSPTTLFIIPFLILLFSGIALAGYVLFFEPIRTHALILAAMLIILSVQVLFFGISSKIYAFKLGLGEKDRIVSAFMSYSFLEKGLTFGAAMVLCGAALGYAVVKAWIEVGFGKLNEFNLAILSILFIILGFQIIFSSFFVSAISME